MHMRVAWPEDLDAIRAIHQRAGYGFHLPDLSTLQALHIVEEDGRILAGAGYQITAQMVGVIAPELSPHRRLEALRLLHPAIAKALLRSPVQEAYSFLDPQFKNFGKRMMAMGWSRKLWDCYFADREAMQAAVHIVEEVECT